MYTLSFIYSCYLETHLGHFQFHGEHMHTFQWIHSQTDGFDGMHMF